MTLRNITLALAASYLVANVYLKKRRDGARSGGSGASGGLGASGGFDGLDRTASSSDEDTGGASSAGAMAGGEGATMTGVTGTVDSPNAGERLNASLAGVKPGGTDQLFGSNSQEGAEPKAPGLPDLMRGA